MPLSIQYPHTIQAVLSSPWAIQEEQLGVLLGVLARRAAGNGPDLVAVEAAVQSRRPSDPVISGAVGVLPLYGTLLPKANLATESSGATSLERWSADLSNLARDQSVKAIVLDVDSPGGSVSGLPEAVSTMRAVRAETGKPIVAVSATLCASAAYWIASQADEIVASPSSITGSIGVIAVHEAVARALDAEGVDVTLISAGRYKSEGNPFELLGDDARAAFQATVNEFYSEFVSAVAIGRGTQSSAVRSGYGEGRALTATRAVEAGLVDRIGSLAETVDRLQQPRGRNVLLRGEEQVDLAPVAAQPTIEELASAVLANLEGTRS